MSLQMGPETRRKRKETWQKPRHRAEKESPLLQPEDGGLFRVILRRRKAVQLLRKASGRSRVGGKWHVHPEPGQTRLQVLAC